MTDEKEYTGQFSQQPRPDKCANCGHPRSEHSYNGACYGLCGKFVEPTDRAKPMSSPYFISAEERASNLINSFDPPLDEWLRQDLYHEIVELVKAAEVAIRLEDITIAERWSAKNAANAIRSRLT